MSTAFTSAFLAQGVDERRFVLFRAYGRAVRRGMVRAGVELGATDEEITEVLQALGVWLEEPDSVEELARVS